PPLASLDRGSVAFGSIGDFSQFLPSSSVTYTSTLPSPDGPNFSTSNSSRTWRLLTICTGSGVPRGVAWGAVVVGGGGLVVPTTASGAGLDGLGGDIGSRTASDVLPMGGRISPGSAGGFGAGRVAAAGVIPGWGVQLET